MRGRATIWAALTASLLLAACGSSNSNENQGAEATGSFPVSVSATFPGHQTLAQPSQLIIRVHNLGDRTLPNVAVTLSNPADGAGAQALGTLIAQPAPGQPILASRSRPVWIIDQNPGPCGYSCRQGGPGAAATAYTNTWALGRLAPGRTAVFDWHVTAVRAGRWTVGYQVAAGLSGQATATGAATAGSLPVSISSRAPQAYVNNDGQVVTVP